MFTITASESTTVGPSSRKGRAHTATVFTTGGALGAGLEEHIPMETKILHILHITDGDRHVYQVTVHGYTIEEFLKIVEAYRDQKFAEAGDLIKTLKSRQPGQ